MRLRHPLVTVATVLIAAGVLAWAWRRPRIAPAPATSAAARATTAPAPAAAASSTGAATAVTARAVADPPTTAPVAPSVPVDRLPLLDPQPQELHGTWLGQRWWARLLTPDASGARTMQLVYQPPAPTELDGTVLVDCPFIRLDAHARVIAWDGRDGLSRVDPWSGGYHLIREVHIGEGDEATPKQRDRRIVGEPGWDLRLAPLLLTIAWRDRAAEVRLVDLFGPRAGQALVLRWDGTRVDAAGATWTVVPDADGRVARIRAGDADILSVDGRP